MLITKEMLIEKKACEEEIELFDKIFPDGAIIPDDLEKAEKAGLNTYWAFKTFKLTGEYKSWSPIAVHIFFKDGKPDFENFI